MNVVDFLEKVLKFQVKEFASHKCRGIYIRTVMISYELFVYVDDSLKEDNEVRQFWVSQRIEIEKNFDLDVWIGNERAWTKACGKGTWKKLDINFA